MGALKHTTRYSQTRLSLLPIDFREGKPGLPAALFICVLLVLLLASCAQVAEKPAVIEAEVSAQGASLLGDSELKRYRQGLSALQNNDLVSAERIFSEFASDHPELAGAYSNLALIHFTNQDYDRSLASVDSALALNPAQAQGHLIKGLALINTGKIQDAGKSLARAVELEPDYANAQYNLALFYDIYLQDIPAAIKHYENYLSLLNEPDPTTQDWVEELKRALGNV